MLALTDLRVIGRAGPPSFTAARLDRLAEMERSHFWFAGRRDLIDSLLTKYLAHPHARLADIGCGGGYYCQLLATKGYRMTAIDLLPGGLAARAPRSAHGECRAERRQSARPARCVV